MSIDRQAAALNAARALAAEVKESTDYWLQQCQENLTEAIEDIYDLTNSSDYIDHMKRHNQLATDVLTLSALEEEDTTNG